MRRKKNKGCLPIIAGLVVLGLVVVGYIYGKKQYENTLNNMEKQIAALPEFDEKATAEKIARKLKIPYPVAAPAKTRSDLKKEAEKKTKAMSASEYPPKKLAKQISAILKKLRCVKEGEHVKFSLNSTRNDVSGTFRRISYRRKDKFVKVNLKKYLYNDISEEYLYLFNPELAARQAAAKVKEAKDKFKRYKREYYQRTLKRTEKQLYTSNGYVKKDGAWVSNQDIVANILASEKLNHKRNIKKKTASILEKNQLFGFIPVSRNKDAKKITKETDEMDETDKEW